MKTNTADVVARSAPAPTAEPVHTTCAYCGVGCGFVVSEDRSVLQADRHHPANLGRFCVKGNTLLETTGLENRLLHAQVDGQTVSLDVALNETATRLHTTIQKYGKQAVAFYVSGQLLTEDYYVANKLMKGFIGTANIDTNSRLCMSTAVTAHKRVLGSDSVPGCYEDFECADLIVITGSNMAWTHPVIYQRIMAAKTTRPALKLIVIDPRRTATAESADLHLQLIPGTDAFLFDGLFAHLVRSAAVDMEFIEQHTNGFDEVISASLQRSTSIDVVAGQCGLAPHMVAEFFSDFATTAKTVTVFSQGINQSASGVDKASAILHCHLATAKIGKPGACPFSITGQPNAMGGREVGGLANQLAAHMELDNPAHQKLVQSFWGSEGIADSPGLKAVDLFEAIDQGQVRFIWIMATNPVVSLPDADRVRDALAKCDCVVVSDCVADNDTLRLAHIKLPAAGWGEKDGTVTNSERCISRQRAFLPLPADARPDWWLICEVAKRCGYSQQFSYQGAADIFREHARLSAYQNNGTRDFDIGALADISDCEYEQLSPLYWPFRRGQTSTCKRLFADGKFFTRDGRANFVETQPKGAASNATQQFPLILNTGRIRDQWHTMTRTGRSSRLQQHRREAFVEVNPHDMAAAGIQDNTLVRLSSAHGSCVLRACADSGQQRGSVFAPIHWSDCFTSAGRIDSLVAAICDPLSGQPAYKQTAVSLSVLTSDWQALLISKMQMTLPPNHYWSYRLLDGFYVYLLEGCGEFDASVIRQQLESQQAQLAELSDSQAHAIRLMAYHNNCVLAGLYVWPAATANHAVKPDENWLLEVFQQLAYTNDTLSARALALGVAASGNNQGALICSCHQVRESVIADAVKNGHDNIEKIGRCTRAGTQCGSCVPELKKLLQALTQTTAAPVDTGAAKAKIQELKLC